MMRYPGPQKLRLLTYWWVMGSGPSKFGARKITVFSQVEHLSNTVSAPLWCHESRQMGLLTMIFRIEL